LRRLLRILLLKPVLWAAAKFSSKPQKDRIFKALSELFESITLEPGKKGLVIPLDLHAGKLIIFSDQHKGAKNGADDFIEAEPNYLAALEHYYNNDYYFISLGDAEELWENSLGSVKKHNMASFEAEKRFLRNGRFVKIFGNHDLFWDNDPFAGMQIKSIYGEDLKVYEGVIFSVRIQEKMLSIFCTHGHQGDAHSDGNWFSKFFVARIWAPFQAFLRINPNTPAYDLEKKTLHNTIMHDWASEQKDKLLITGHTHQPVFESLTHLERLYKKYQHASQQKDDKLLVELRIEIRKREKEFTAVSVDYLTMKPFYFNSGCCCYSDGDITGIEIADGYIRLIKWELVDERPQRVVLEERRLEELMSR
jgi:predicted phosphodiesterase